MSGHDRDSSGVTIDWAAVYRDVYAGLVRYLHSKIWDADRAAELAQEVFVRALTARPDNPRAWLFTVAANIANDETRLVLRRKKHLALLKREVTVEPPRVDPVVAMEREERAEAVRRALDALNERDREVLLLKDAGLSYPEIAERTGLAVGAVGTTLCRARKRLVEAHGSPRERRQGVPADPKERRQGVPADREERQAFRETGR
jgi:RNA polymerase sigma-70 factor (ECF subfamily)